MDAMEKKADLFRRSKKMLDDFLSLSSKTLEEQSTTAGDDGKTLDRVPGRKKKVAEEDTLPQESNNETLPSRENVDQKMVLPEKHIPSLGDPAQGNFGRSVYKDLKPGQPFIETEAATPVPVYKWGLQFSNGPGQSIGAFLQRVEELRHARGVSETQLFRSAVDLFTGNALIWYRSTVGRINSWEQLCTEMKLVFQTPDYDDMLLQEIMNRTQGEQEHIDLFIAAIEGLYGRLSNPVPESVRLRQILKNLNNYLQDKLCMFVISSIDELRQMGRKAEIGRLRTTHSRPPPRPGTVLEPDLAYSRTDYRKNTSNPQIHALNNSMTLTPRQLKCWNCNGVGHKYSHCSKERKLFCFGCGHAGYRKTTCPTCSSKNGARREPPQNK